MTRQLVAVLSALCLTTLAACDVAMEASEQLIEAPRESKVQARGCAHCGWIESKREILSAASDAPAARSYEYTVRMHDGSSTVFRQALPASWRLRERLTVIGGVPLN
jgi:hypothetical protein